MLLRANVLAAGFSGVRLATLELLVEMLNRGVHPVVPSQGSVGASGDLAPLAHLALRARRRGRVPSSTAGSLPGAEALRAAGLRPVDPRGQGGPRPHQRHPADDRASAGSRWPTPIGRPRRRRRRARSRSTRCRAPTWRSTRASTPRARTRARPPRRATCERLLAGSAIARVAPRLRPGAGRLQPALHAAGPRRGARRARATRARVHRDRDERRHRQPDGLRRDGRDRSRAATSTASRSPSPSTSSRSRPRSSARISERRTERLVNPTLSGLPAVPGPRGRPALGPDDGAGHGGGPGLREQGRSPTPRASTRSRPRPARRTTSPWARPPHGRPRAPSATPPACWRWSFSPLARRSSSTGRSARRPRSRPSSPPCASTSPTTGRTASSARRSKRSPRSSSRAPSRRPSPPPARRW